MAVLGAIWTVWVAETLGRRTDWRRPQSVAGLGGDGACVGSRLRHVGPVRQLWGPKLGRRSSLRRPGSRPSLFVAARPVS